MSTPIYVTGKSSPTKRIANDFYETPPHIVGMTLKRFSIDYPYHKFPKTFDYGCGHFVWGNGVRHFWPSTHITGIDIKIDPADHHFYDSVIETDINHYLDGSSDTYDLIIGNPPYKNIDKIMPKLFERLNDFGAMAFLFPLQYLQGQKRYKTFVPFLQKVYVYVDRIKWYGKSPHGQHAFFIYRKMQISEPPILEFLK